MARALVAAPCQNASMRRPRPTLALAAVVCAAACATNPATGKKQLMLVSEAQELAMGRASDAEVVAAYGLYADAEIQAYVDRIGQRLAAASERPGLPWSFKVVDDPAVNAFALPGGFIYVTRGILAHLGSEAQLIVLPETAIPRFLDTVDPAYLAELARHAESQRGDILLGVPLRERGRMTNSVVTLGSSPAQHYSKVHLVPLGEFVPAEFGWIVSVLRIPLSDFDRGSERQRPLRAGGARIAVNICYEDAFGEEIIGQLPEATLLANVSNVAWFGDSLAPSQHLQISRMRALETGRTMLRATNTGVTAIIDQRGAVVARLPGFTEAVLQGQAQQFSGATPYTRLGNLPVLALASLLLLMVLGLTLRGNAGGRVSGDGESR